MSKAVLYSIALIILGGYFHSNAQVIDTINDNVVLIRDAGVDTLIQRVINKNKEKQTIKGYRVQIYSGTNHSKANKVKAEFMMAYPKEDIILFYQQPNFKVRIGNYRNRIEAMKMYHTLLDDTKFRSVLLVPDEINLPELKISVND